MKLSSILTTIKSGLPIVKGGLKALMVSGLAFLLAITIGVMMIGLVQREADDNQWSFSPRRWITSMKIVMIGFPIPETAVDYITWTFDVIGWFAVFWSALVTSGFYIVNDFDGSVGAIPVTPPIMAM